MEKKLNFKNPDRTFNGKLYRFYVGFGKDKRGAMAEANRSRKSGWLTRIVKSSLGYDLYVRQK